MGISGHLVHGAAGHFETFHKGIFLAMKEILGEKNCNFLGSQISKETNSWFTANLPSSLVSRVPWLPKRFLNSLVTPSHRANENFIMYIYEGNLANLFLLGSVVRQRSNIFLYFNLFDSNRYKSIFRSNFRLLMFKSLFLLAYRGLDSKVYLSADTKRFAQLLTRKLGKKFSEYPMYSALDFQPSPGSQVKKILINFRGQQSEKLMESAIKRFPALQGLELDLHGLHDQSVMQDLSRFPNITILPDQVDESTYFGMYKYYYRVAFIYDPDFFSMQSSGRLADAILAGAQLVVPRNTSLEDVLNESGNGNTFSFSSCESLASALISEPTIPKRADYLPTSSRAAQVILNSMEELIKESGSVLDQQYRRAINIALDESIRRVLWSLRIVFGVGNRLRRFFKRKT
jgi:hypothetical protein